MSEMTEQSQNLSTTTINWREWLQEWVVLFKLRVVSLLLLAAVGGAFLGARATGSCESRHPVRWLHGVAFFIQFDAYALSFWGGRSALPAHALACLS